jgi:glutathione S-transferase
MSEFTVHSIPGSPFGRAVLATLEEKGGAYRLVPVAPGSFRSPEHLARNAFGRVPVIEQDGFRLYETQAILRYLDRVLPGPALTPADPRAAARMDQLLNIGDWYLFQGCCSIIGFQRVVAPRLLGRTPDEAAIAEAMPRAHTVMATLSRLLGDQTYLTGDAVTLADIGLAPHVDFLAATPEWAPLTEEAGNIVGWLERMNARPSLRKTTWDAVEAMAKAA